MLSRICNVNRVQCNSILNRKNYCTKNISNPNDLGQSKIRKKSSNKQTSKRGIDNNSQQTIKDIKHQDILDDNKKYESIVTNIKSLKYVMIGSLSIVSSTILISKDPITFAVLSGACSPFVYTSLKSNKYIHNFCSQVITPNFCLRPLFNKSLNNGEKYNIIKNNCIFIGKIITGLTTIIPLSIIVYTALYTPIISVFISLGYLSLYTFIYNANETDFDKCLSFIIYTIFAFLIILSILCYNI
jgi:hypothetical protein